MGDVGRAAKQRQGLPARSARPQARVRARAPCVLEGGSRVEQLAAAVFESHRMAGASLAVWRGQAGVLGTAGVSVLAAGLLGR